MMWWRVLIFAALITAAVAVGVMLSGYQNCC
jgi:hypothetical protein